ncbi:MAG: hypothetical protein ACREAM_07390 [Blastocatellia bacterium]
MNTAHKGRRAEYKSIALLEASGYVCIRAAASKGVFDLVAVRSDSVAFVQVKSGRWPGADEMRAMADFPAPANCRKVVHR